MYKARGQRLKIALEAAQAYNRVKPPHQTVGDAVMLAFQHAMGAAEKGNSLLHGSLTCNVTLYCMGQQSDM